MSNPFHPDTPHYAAWERLRTLHISPDVGDINLRELIEETLIATQEVIAKSVAAETRRKAIGDIYAMADKIANEASRLIRYLEAQDER